MVDADIVSVVLFVLHDAENIDSTRRKYTSLPRKQRTPGNIQVIMFFRRQNIPAGKSGNSCFEAEMVMGGGGGRREGEQLSVDANVNSTALKEERFNSP